MLLEERREMLNPKISLFSSAIRFPLWKEYLESLKSTSVTYEVVFSGRCSVEEVKPFLNKYPELKYIHTADIKPSQNYAIASRYCTGETISWSCDDANYENDVMGKAYKFWKERNNEKLILSIQTKESGYGTPVGKLFDMNQHTFYSLVTDTPIMCPMNLMSRKFFNGLGGYDQRYVAGQAENDLCLRAYQNGGKPEIFGGEDCYIFIDHLAKSIAIGESTDEESFRERPFATGYSQDRQILEASWTTFDQAKAFKRLDAGERPHTLRDVSPTQIDAFQPYPVEIPLTYSLSNKGRWL